MTTHEQMLLARAFSVCVDEQDRCALLAYLNEQTEYRFSGVFAYTANAVVCVALFDRDTQSMHRDCNVGHRVRSFAGVQLRDSCGAPWGALCHFSFVRHTASQDPLASLGALRPLVEELFVQDSTASASGPEHRGRA